jgi:signal transduction histidine kinase
LRERPAERTSFACLPLRGDGGLAQVLAFGFSGRTFDEEERAFVMAVARHCEEALQRARLYEAERRSAERLGALQSVTSQLSGAATPVDVGRIMVAQLVATAGARAAIVLSASDDDALELIAHRGVATVNLEPLRRFHLEMPYPVALAARERRPVWIDSAAEYAREFPEAWAMAEANGSGVTASLPLLIDDRLVGVVAVGFPPERRLDGAERAFVATLADQCAQALDRARLYTEARDAVRLRDDFLSIASHELNTPLTSLKLALAHLGRRAFEPDTASRLLGTAERQVTRLNSLVNELLDVSRITAGKLKLDPEDIDLVAAVAEVVSRLSVDVQRSGSELTVESDGPVIGRWDPLRIDQVATNLLSNAIKFGEGRPIRVRVSAEGNRARLVVKDAGIGIAPEEQARIFERFERAVATPHFGGFGLGLWIVRQIVEAMAGEIRVESAPGEGSTFTVELPRGT